MDIKLAKALGLIKAIDDIATDKNKLKCSTQLALDAIHHIIEIFEQE